MERGEKRNFPCFFNDAMAKNSFYYDLQANQEKDQKLKDLKKSLEEVRSTFLASPLILLLGLCHVNPMVYWKCNVERLSAGSLINSS